MIGLAVFAALAFLGGLLIERALLSWRPTWYFTAGFPLLPELVPIPSPPNAESGRTASVHWDRVGDLVRFWALPGERDAPMGLHGAIRLVRGPRGVHLVVRWSPPWSPMLASAWLAGLGFVRHEYFAIPIAAMLVLAVLFAYRTYAVRAAAELRWSWVREE
jgi:hypothetical protein